MQQPMDHDVPARGELLQALQPFAQPVTRTGVLLFAADYAVLIAALALALLADNVLLRVIGAVLAGFKMGGLYSLAHDAAHNSLTASRRLNRLLGVLAHLPLFFNHRLWLHDHNATHHPGTNGPQKDAFTPMSLEAYRAAPRWRRAWERFGRSGHPLSLAPYYLLGRYAEAKVVPTREFPRHVRRQAWPHVLLTAAYAGAMLALLAWHSAGDAAAFAADVVFVLLLPFFVFLTVIAAVLYFQHTHPDIPWFADGDPARPAFGQEQLTVRVRVPRWLGNTGHNGFEHPAHHVCPSIPCYRLHEAQQRLSQLIGPASVEVPFSWTAMKDIFRRCKLYDYTNRRWVDFEGRPT